MLNLLLTALILCKCTVPGVCSFIIFCIVFEYIEMTLLLSSNLGPHPRMDVGN